MIGKVNTKRKEYNVASTNWEKVRDAVSGQEAIKAQGRKYLPSLPGNDDKGYNGYLLRAQYTNFTGRTHQTSISQIFRNNPISNVDLEEFNNIDLAGTSFLSFSRQIMSEILIVNRIGLWVDFNEDQDRPYIKLFEAETIINWRTSNINGNEQLTLVVLEGLVDIPDPIDAFKTSKQLVWNVLFINDDGNYQYNQYKKPKSNDNEFTLVSETVPIMNDEPLTFIPFVLGNVQGVSSKILKSPLNDFVNINLGHYVNSADNENRLHFTGAVTLVTKGLSEDTVIPIGGSFDVGQDGDALYLEAEADSGLTLEMKNKEERMAVLGSNLLAGAGRYVASAKTAEISSENEYATLADISKALSDIMSVTLSIFANWSPTITEDKVVVEYNTDFNTGTIESAELDSFNNTLEKGYISKETYHFNLSQREMYPDGWNFEMEQKFIERDRKDNTSLGDEDKQKNKNKE